MRRAVLFVRDFVTGTSTNGQSFGHRPILHFWECFCFLFLIRKFFTSGMFQLLIFNSYYNNNIIKEKINFFFWRIGQIKKWKTNAKEGPQEGKHRGMVSWTLATTKAVKW